MKLTSRIRVAKAVRNTDRFFRTTDLIEGRVPDAHVRGVEEPMPLGDNMTLLPGRGLLCRNVRLARTGTQRYRFDEINWPADHKPVFDASGFVTVHRTAEHVFAPEALASFEGLPFTNDHPADGDVSTMTWAQRAKGEAYNIRRGEGADSDFMIGDVMVRDQGAINDIAAGKREVSCGYDSDYLICDDGSYQQVNLRGNHIALVDRGRCGASCAILDKEPTMATATNTKPLSGKIAVRSVPRNPPKRQTILDRMLGRTAEAPARRSPVVDADAVVEAIQEATDAAAESGETQEIVITIGPEGDVDASAAEAAAGADDAATAAAAASAADAASAQNGDVPPPDAMGARMDAQDAKIDALTELVQTIVDAIKGDAADAAAEAANRATDRRAAPPARQASQQRAADAAPAANGGDMTALVNEWQATLAGAEILSPGVHMPTQDSYPGRSTERATRDSMCMLRRRSLDAAYATAPGKAVIDRVLDGAKPRWADAATPCSETKLVFTSAVAITKAERQAASAQNRSVDAAAGLGAVPATPAPLSSATLNKQNRDFWDKKA